MMLAQPRISPPETTTHALNRLWNDHAPWEMASGEAVLKACSAWLNGDSPLRLPLAP